MVAIARRTEKLLERHRPRALRPRSASFQAQDENPYSSPHSRTVSPASYDRWIVAQSNRRAADSTGGMPSRRAWYAEVSRDLRGRHAGAEQFRETLRIHEHMFACVMDGAVRAGAILANCLAGWSNRQLARFWPWNSRFESLPGSVRILAAATP
jgi:hypothetical protein